MSQATRLIAEIKELQTKLAENIRNHNQLVVSIGPVIANLDAQLDKLLSDRAPNSERLIRVLIEKLERSNPNESLEVHRKKSCYFRHMIQLKTKRLQTCLSCS
jgi:hypothetical protein